MSDEIDDDARHFVCRNALASLAAAQIGWDEQAARYVYEVQDLYGGRGLAGVATYWVHALREATFPEGLPDGAKVMPVWRENRPGSPVEFADDVPAYEAWAGRVVAAYMSDDPETFGALLMAVPDGEGKNYVPALLDLCAEGIVRAQQVRHFMATTRIDDLIN